jgi:hypothetical protein
MFVLSCFYYEPWWAWALRMLLEGATELMVYATPVAICVVVWDIFGKHGDTSGNMTTLGLDASAPTYLPAVEQGVSAWRLVLYLLTCVTTFGFGVLSFDFVQALSLPTFRVGLLIFDAVQVLS